MDRKDRPLLIGPILWIEKLETISAPLVTFIDRTIILTGDTNTDIEEKAEVSRRQ